MFINRLDVVETKLKGTNRLDIMAIDSMHIEVALFLENQLDTKNQSGIKHKRAVDSLKYKIDFIFLGEPLEANSAQGGVAIM